MKRVTLKLHQHYLHPSHGYLKYEGVRGVAGLFLQYEKFSTGKWVQTTSHLMLNGYECSKLKECPPPA